MGQYKLYYLNHAGKIFSARDVTCVEDMDAVDMATSLLNGHDIEVWQGARRIAHVKASEQERVKPTAFRRDEKMSGFKY